MSLTGLTRYRTTLTGKFVLQVEENRYFCHDLNGSGYYDEGHFTAWRDAKTTDLAYGSELYPQVRKGGDTNG